MKKFIILAINIYQYFISLILKNILGVNKFCRFSENCSSFSKRMIEEKGVFRGMFLSLQRILRCQPFYKAY